MDEYLGRTENPTETTTDNVFSMTNEMLDTASSPLVGTTVLESDGMPPDATESTLFERIPSVAEEPFLYAENFNVKVKRYRLKK